MNALASRDVSGFEETCKIVVSRYFAPGLDRDDLLQEARIGVWKGLRDYQPGRGSLSAFVGLCAERQVQTAVKMARAGKHRPLNLSASLDAPAPTEEGEGSWHDVVPNDGPDVIDLLAVRERVHEIGTAFRERLSDFECACIVGLLNAESYQEIATRIGVSAKAVDVGITKARYKLLGVGPPSNPEWGTQRRRGVNGYACPSCGGATVKKPGRGRPPRCVVCRVRRGEIAT